MIDYVQLYCGVGSMLQDIVGHPAPPAQPLSQQCVIYLDVVTFAVRFAVVIPLLWLPLSYVLSSTMVTLYSKSTKTK